MNYHSLIWISVSETGYNNSTVYLMLNKDPLLSDGCGSSRKSKVFSLTTVSCMHRVWCHACYQCYLRIQASVSVCGQQEINYDFVLHVWDASYQSLIRFVSIYQIGCIISMLCFMGTKDLVPSDECGSTRKSKVLNLTSVSCKQSVCRNFLFPHTISSQMSLSPFKRRDVHFCRPKHRRCSCCILSFFIK